MNAGPVFVLYRTAGFSLGWISTRRWQQRFHSTPEGDNLLTDVGKNVRREADASGGNDLLFVHSRTVVHRSKT